MVYSKNCARLEKLIPSAVPSNYRNIELRSYKEYWISPATSTGLPYENGNH